ncbi:MAG: hypothetical protein AB7E51_18150 [Pseudodesulfovibrio sp.]|uniref:hypothetical protein n=1 Tax=Pseudodesulfovibrio sp. TaxID=2035812 RepID=UPI003D12003E
MGNYLQKAMAEMNEGETLVICTPDKHVLFECKKVEAREPKIEGNEGHVFYDEFDLIPDPVVFGLDPAREKSFSAGMLYSPGMAKAGLVLDLSSAEDLMRKLEPLRALFAKAAELPEQLKGSKWRGPESRRKFPLPK